MGFIDLHSHVLPQLDDGADAPATSLAMLRGLRAIGFAHVYATPHQKAGQFLPAWPEVEAAHGRTRTALGDDGVDLALGLGAENMWDDVFYERCQSNTIPSYDGGPAFLVELPVIELPVGLVDRLFALRLRGKLPVLAHPERYQPLWAAPELVARLRQQCALVIDLGAVAGYHGRREAKMARHLLKQGIAHAVATDAHSPSDVRVAAEGIAWIRRKLGEAAVTRLLITNPRRILAGDLPED
jgi:protein-tyrosine phosphatase